MNSGSGPIRPANRRFDRLLLAMLGLLALAVALQSWLLHDARKQQVAIGSALTGDPIDEHASSGQKIARAIWLSRQESWADALRLYQQVETANPDGELAEVARFNAANLNMREANALIASEEHARALPLIEVAKQMYRQLLREHPNDWASRYNLSAALLLSPDPIESRAGPDMPDDAERAITTMRGFSPGLP